MGETSGLDGVLSLLVSSLMIKGVCEDEPGCAGYSLGCISEKCYAFNKSLPYLNENSFSVSSSANEDLLALQERLFLNGW